MRTLWQYCEVHIKAVRVLPTWGSSRRQKKRYKGLQPLLLFLSR